MPGNKLIAVIGSGTQSYPSLSIPLGQWLAEQGHDLLTGGGSGVMAEAAKAFTSAENRQGRAIGILPAAELYPTSEARAAYQSPKGYPNPYIDLVIRTHLPYSGVRGKELASRNHIIVLSADFIIALPGGEGTRSEIELALEYGRPLVIVSPQDEWKEFASRARVVKTVAEVCNRLNGWIHHQ